MGLSPTDVLQYININLGATIQQIEISEEDIMQVIYSQTLPSFSIYYPNYQLIHVSIKHDAVPNRVNAYYLKTDLEIIGVSKVLIDRYFSNGEAYINDYGSTSILNRQIAADLSSMYIQPVTFEYEPPNIISIFPKNRFIFDFNCQLKTVHPKHLQTIPFSYRNEFLECALYDVRIALYPIRQRFSTINTTFGNVELFMDKLESAFDDKKQLLEKWRENFNKSSRKKKMFIG